MPNPVLLALGLAALAAPTAGACVFMAFESLERRIPAELTREQQDASRRENVVLGLAAAAFAALAVLSAWGGA